MSKRIRFCEVCGAEIKEENNYIANRRFCSEICKYQVLVKPYEKYNTWKKGKNAGIKSISNWTKIRKDILDRDCDKCRICGNDNVESKLNVHHIDYDRGNNKLNNLVTLCVVCHRAVHAEQYKPCLYEDWPVPWGENE